MLVTRVMQRGSGSIGSGTLQKEGMDGWASSNDSPREQVDRLEYGMHSGVFVVL